MDSLEGDDTGQLFGADLKLAADHDTGIDGADGQELEHALFGDLAHHKTDLIHMGADGQGLFPAAAVAQGVGHHLVGMGRGQVFNGLAHFVFIAGHTVAGAKDL